MLRHLRLQVGGLVLVDDATLGHAVDDGVDFRKLAFGLALVGQGAELPDFVTHILGVVTVVQTSLFSLTDSLE